MQIIVHFVDTFVLDFDENDVNVIDIKDRVTQKTAIPNEMICLTCNGRVIKDGDIISLDVSFVIRGSVKGGLAGGKGGFGAMLRSLAKQKGGKRTTDFGACRDLSGRRLRHINDEVVLQKWKDAKDRGEEFDVEQRTDSGIDMWFMSTPSWADSFKGKREYRRNFMKPRRKTQLCLDWIRARKEKEAPAGAPVHWGCPRGHRCEYAHGETELRGEALDQIVNDRKKSREEENEDAKRQYLKSIEEGNQEDMSEAVLAGLVAMKKKKKIGILPGHIPTSIANTDQVTTEVTSEVESRAHHADFVEPPVGESDSNSLSLPVISSGTVPIEELTGRIQEPVSSDPANWLRTVSGVTSYSAKGGVRCQEGFGTVLLPKACVSIDSSGLFYYEVTVVSGGLVQMGWATNQFNCNSTSNDGVGDDKNSWAYDGARQLKWHGDSETYGQKWSEGDVIGCILSIEGQLASKTVTMTFTRNGHDLGPAFTSTSCSSAAESRDEEFYPALSLDEEEEVIFNIGQRPFLFPPGPDALSMLSVVEAYKPAVEACSTQPEGMAVVDASTDAITTSNTKTVVQATTTTSDSTSTGPFLEIDLESDSSQYTSVSDLVALGRPHLKAELSRRGLKIGGTVHELAGRLWALKGKESFDSSTSKAGVIVADKKKSVRTS